jgi:hypothetical protein
VGWVGDQREIIGSWLDMHLKSGSHGGKCSYFGPRAKVPQDNSK